MKINVKVLCAFSATSLTVSAAAAISIIIIFGISFQKLHPSRQQRARVPFQLDHFPLCHETAWSVTLQHWSFQSKCVWALLYIPKATEPRAQELGLCRWKILVLKFAFCLPRSVSWASRLTSQGHRTPAVRWGQSWCLAQNTLRSTLENILCWAWSEHLVPGIYLLLLLLIA